jgi:hypothetical protein
MQCIVCINTPSDSPSNDIWDASEPISGGPPALTLTHSLISRLIAVCAAISLTECVRVRRQWGFLLRIATNMNAADIELSKNTDYMFAREVMGTYV